MHTLSCVQLCNPVDCSPPDSVHGTFLASTLQGVAISYSRGSSQPRDRTRVSCLLSPVSCTGRRVLYQLCHLGSQMRIHSFHSEKKDHIRSVFFMLIFYTYYYVLDTLHVLRHLILFSTLKYLQATFTTTLIIKYVSLRGRLTPVCHSMVSGKDKCCFPIISIKIFNSRLKFFQFFIN